MKNKKTNYLWLATDDDGDSRVHSEKLEKGSDGNYYVKDSYDVVGIYIGKNKSKPGTCQKVRLEIVK